MGARIQNFHKRTYLVRKVWLPKLLCPAKKEMRLNITIMLAKYAVTGEKNVITTMYGT